MLKIHQGHQGILKCRLRVWWPGVSNEVGNFVKQCYTCSQRCTPPVEPMIVSELPDYLWQKVEANLFELEGIKYLLLVDYFSCYIEVVKLMPTTLTRIISVLKIIFSRYGIPERLISDNGPQFASRGLKVFSVSYGMSQAARIILRVMVRPASSVLHLGKLEEIANTWYKRVESQDAEHQPPQAAEQNVVPELPAPTLVRDPIITRSKSGTKLPVQRDTERTNDWGGGGGGGGAEL